MNFLLKFLIGFCLCIIGSSIIIILNLSTLGIILGIFFFILAFFTLFVPKISPDDDAYKKSKNRILMIPDAVDVTMNSLYESFKDIDTHYGKPWIAKSDLAPGKCLVFGPTNNGEYVYIYKAAYGSNLYVAENDNPTFLKPLQKDAWRLIPHKSENEFKYPICMALASISVFDDIFNSLNAYVKTNKPMQILTEENKNYVFIIHNDLLTLKPKYTITNLDEKPIFDIHKLHQAFSVCLYNSREEILRCVRLQGPVPQYDIYKSDDLYFTFTKKNNFQKGHFSVDTPNGKLTVQNTPDKLGAKYMVKIDGIVIGTIADKLATPTETIRHYVVHARSEQYMSLLTALTVMVLREFNLDNNL
ncbi:MAG: hypothetical protein R3Y12_03925 [Clostridia bacterium]